MKKIDPQEFAACFWCDNIVTNGYDGLIGLLHLGFPRCMILIRDLDSFEFSDFESWRGNIADIQWLDPSDKGTPQEQEEVITRLWNFSVLYDEMNEQYYNDNEYESED